MTGFDAASAGLSSRYIDVDGINTRYFDVGQGTPLVLVHGGGAGADSFGNWYRTIPLLRDFRLLVVDMLGFGESLPEDPAAFAFTQSARTQHLAGFIRKLGLSGVSIVGNSMGGMTSMGVSIEYPGLIGKLVLMGSAGLNKKSRPEMQPVANYDFTREGMERIVGILAHADFHVEPEMIDYRYRIATEPKAKACYQATMGWVKQQGGLFYEEDFISRVSVPTLVVGGKNDIVVPLELNMRYLQLIPQSWGFFLPRCGHWAMLEHPEPFANAVRNFLET